MTEGLTIKESVEEEMEKLLDEIAILEEKLRLSDLTLSGTEVESLKSMKVKLSDYEKSFQKELDRIIADAVKAGDGADFGITEKK